MPLYTEALARILPNGGELYLALLTTAPGIDGTGEVEASYPGYARVLHTAWATHTDSEGPYASNTGAIVFAAVAQASVTVVAWGIYTLEKPNLVASGPMMDSLYAVKPWLLAVGDQARFNDDVLRIRAGT